MLDYIIKRDGSKVDFDQTKIYKAIKKAMKYGSGIINETVAKNITFDIHSYYCDNEEIPTVSNIEHMVYLKLIDYGENLTAKAYEGYRAVQEYKREINTTDKNILGLLDQSNKDVLDENSNKNGKLISTQRDLIAGEVSKDIAKRMLIPTHIVQAHNDGVLHFHDMDYTIQRGCFNCCLINLEDMLQNGTVINNKLVEPPKSFSTACTVATQIIAQIASGQFGGNTINIKHLAPFLRVSYNKYYKHYIDLGLDEELAKKLAKDRRDDELKAGVQTIRYQISTLHTSNGQSPFCTIALIITEGSEYEQEEADICYEMIRQRLEGMKNYKGQEISEEFPKLVYVLDEHNCLEGGKYDYITKLAAECSNKRLCPDYLSAKILKQNYGDIVVPMGCRAFLSPWKDENGNLKWWGRFNQGPISLNLVQIGLIANKDMDKFWEILDERTELCKEALLVRHNLLKGATSDVSPIHWQHGGLARLKPGEKIDKLLEGGYSTLALGYVGLYELTQAMLGVSHTTELGEKFALSVISYLRLKCDTWKKETGLGFALYGTPGENTDSRFCNIDKEKFGIIKNVTDKGYYTNSYHVHVTEQIDAFSKLKFESKFQNISSGGCISYIEVPNMSKNLKAIEQVINFIYHNIQYAEINTKPDICYECGYQGEMKTDENLHWYCPNCNNHNQNQMQVVRRTCGYIGSNLWSKGRTKEIIERVLHL